MEHPILNFHEKQVGKMNLPEWVTAIDCPFCEEDIALRAIYNIQLCLNTRNFGEVAIEVFCNKCKKMDTVYLRTKLTSIDEYIECLKGIQDMPQDVIVEEDMFKMNYNNVAEQMAQQQYEDKK